MYKVCIFDLDGTIADTVESMAYVGNQVLQEFGLTALPVENYNFYAGDGADELVRRMLAATPGGDKADYEQIRTVYRQRFAENPFYHVKPFDGIIELLEKLKEENIKIAVLSNKPHEAAVEVVNKIFGETMFHKVQGQTERIPRKPSPVGALAIAEAFGVKPEECLYCGDTNTDMECCGWCPRRSSPTGRPSPSRPGGFRSRFPLRPSAGCGANIPSGRILKTALSSCCFPWRCPCSPPAWPDTV